MSEDIAPSSLKTVVDASLIEKVIPLFSGVVFSVKNRFGNVSKISLGKLIYIYPVLINLSSSIVVLNLGFMSKFQKFGGKRF